MPKQTKEKSKAGKNGRAGQSNSENLRVKAMGTTSLTTKPQDGIYEQLLVNLLKYGPDPSTLTAIPLYRWDFALSGQIAVCESVLCIYSHFGYTDYRA